MEKKRKKYYEYVKSGLEINPLTQPNCAHPGEILADRCFIVKSNLILLMIQSLLKLGKDSSVELGTILLQDGFVRYDETTGNPIPESFKYTDTKRFFKLIKTAFGVKNMKTDLWQYLGHTGTTEIDCAYVYNRKENKMKLSLRQIPIQLEYFKN